MKKLISALLFLLSAVMLIITACTGESKSDNSYSNTAPQNNAQSSNPASQPAPAVAADTVKSYANLQTASDDFNNIDEALKYI